MRPSAWPPCALLLLGGVACTTAKKVASIEDIDPVPLASEASELPERELPAPAALAAATPLELTASDGTGLRLVSVKARGVVQQPLAFTELHLTFENPENRVLEGQFTIDLPPDSAISRFAMKIGGTWQEGEVVERRAARVAYEDFLHRKQDPALLENQGGNRFSARVFPIPPRGRKELIVSYSQELGDARVPYKLLLAGLPELDELDVEILDHSTGKTVKLDERSHRPELDLEIASVSTDAPVGLRHGELAVARVQAAGSMPPAPIEELTILLDTSASRSLDFAGQLHRLGELVAALREHGEFQLQVVVFDQDVSLQFEGPASALGAEHLTAIYSRRALGASDLGGALQRIAVSGTASKRVLLISDGIATAGDSEIDELKGVVRALRGAGVVRLDAMVDGGLQDRDTLASLTTAGLEHAGIVVDARLSAKAIADKLSKTTLPKITIDVPGSEFVWPTTIEGVQAGDEVLVYAQLPKSAAMTVVLSGEDRVETEVELTTVERPLLERALAGARIDALTLRRSELAGIAGELGEITAEIVALSTKHRVLSDFTALLVLETEADYERFAIDRNALTDIMTVGPQGIELLQRSKHVTEVAKAATIDADDGKDSIPMMAGGFDPDPPPPAADDEDVWGGLAGDEIGEAFGVGGLGLVGTARGGGGSGEGTIGLGSIGLIGRGGGGGTGSGYGQGAGAGFGGRGKRVPVVRLAKAVVHGSLDKDIIRRIVRAHLNEVRHCYNQGLVRDPTLSGRVAVQFSIDRDGKVSAAVVSESSLADGDVGSCIAKAVKRWTFPRSEGRVVVNYPFVLAPVEPSSPEALERDRQRQLEEARASEAARREQAELARTEGSPYTGRMYDVMQLIGSGKHREALAEATTWSDEQPGDVLALLAMGEALEVLHKDRAAARVYGSLIDLFPSRADIRRYAGHRLERVGKIGQRLAVDSYRHALLQRPDHPNSHRLYAYALLRDGRPREAFEAIVAGAERRYPEGRFLEADRILLEDVGLIAAALIAADPTADEAIMSADAKLDVTVATGPSTRFVLSWETDANDVDFHIRDGKGGHAFFSAKELASGGALYGDVTTGYGPECFTIDGEPMAFPYVMQANYYARGPMGYGMGKLQIVQHDGHGGLTFEDRPFLIMKDEAFVDMGSLDKPLP